MSMDDDIIRAALGGDCEPDGGARFSAMVLYRRGRRRRMRRRVVQVALLAGVAALFALIGPRVLAALTAPGPRIDAVTLAAGLALLLLCAMAAPRRA